MKKINLDIAQRIQLVSFLNSYQGKSFETLVQVWKLLEKVGLKEEEKVAVGLKVEGNQVIWDSTKAKDITVEFSGDEEKAFCEEFDSRSKENKLDVTLYNLAQVYLKLKETPK